MHTGRFSSFLLLAFTLPMEVTEAGEAGEADLLFYFEDARGDRRQFLG